jgi:hypothetical protein
MNTHTLRHENYRFADTNGISQNAGPKFRPAFLDRSTGVVELARFANGQPATFHLISWLPNEWALSHNADGSVESIKSTVISGFECDGVFYTRDEASEL